MPIPCFSLTQPWGTAEAHQRENPQLWTPELIEVTSAWTVVVRAIVQGQDFLNRGLPDSFVKRCVEDASLRAALDLILERSSPINFHDLLVAWVMEGIRERLTVHAVPAFWQHYREAAASVPANTPLNAVQQRRLQTAFFAAVGELHTYVTAQLQLVAIVDGKRWHQAAEAALQASGEAGSSAPADVFAPTMQCKEVTDMLQAVLLLQAPDASTFGTWLTICWHRSFADVCKGTAAAGGMGDEEDEAGEDDEDEPAEWGEDEENENEDDAMQTDDAALLPPQAATLRLCCAAVHSLGWLPLVEPALSAMLHEKLYVQLVKTCAKSFDERMLHRCAIGLTTRHSTPPEEKDNVGSCQRHAWPCVCAPRLAGCSRGWARASRAGFATCSCPPMRPRRRPRRRCSSGSRGFASS